MNHPEIRSQSDNHNWVIHYSSMLRVLTPTSLIIVNRRDCPLSSCLGYIQISSSNFAMDHVDPSICHDVVGTKEETRNGKMLG